MVQTTATVIKYVYVVAYLFVLCYCYIVLLLLIHHLHHHSLVFRLRLHGEGAREGGTEGGREGGRKEGKRREGGRKGVRERSIKEREGGISRGNITLRNFPKARAVSHYSISTQLFSACTLVSRVFCTHPWSAIISS